MKVSVLVNNYNYGRFLDECLLSLKHQSVLADEVILYDDGSKDDSLVIASKHDFVKIISRKNYGKKPSFNQGNAIWEALKLSTGDVICLLDSDDYFHKNKIKYIKNSFVDDVVLVQNAFFEFTEDGEKIFKNYGKKDKDYKNLYRNNNWTGYYNSTSCLSFKRSYLEKLLPIEDDGNWIVWPDVRLSRLAPYFGKVISLSEGLTFYRRHGHNDSSIMNIDPAKVLRNQIAHHNYVNSELIKYGFKKIRFKRSFNYLKFKLKTIVPKSVLSFMKSLKQYSN